MSIYGWFQGVGPSGFGYNSTAEQVSEGLDLSGRTFLVTGASSGLGFETARVLLIRGARVLVAARSQEKAEATAQQLQGAAVPVACELADPSSIRSALAEVRKLGHPLAGIIANAGIMALPQRQLAHGLELQFFTNHVGHFQLVCGLLDQLADDGRVVMLSSGAHHQAYPEGIRFDDLDAAKSYSPWGAYGQSKLANLLFARELATRLPKPGQTANAIHPGVIVTNLGRHLSAAIAVPFRVLGPLLALKSVGAGAATQVYVAVHPDAATVNGEYWADCNVKPSSQLGTSKELAQRLWEATEEIVARL